jgi:hypothetical protein
MRALTAMLVLTVGCATQSARIHRTDRPPTDAVIDGSDASTLQLRGPSGDLLVLDQYRVASIDHPGNVIATIGGVSIGIGVLCLAPFVVERQRGNADNPSVGLAVLGFPLLVVGLPVFIYNMMVWEESKARAAAFESARPPAWMIAPAVPGQATRIPPYPPGPDGSPDGVSEEPDPEPKPRRGFHR